MRTKRRLAAIPALLAAFGLIAAACGDDSGGDSDTTAATSAAATSAASTTAGGATTTAGEATTTAGEATTTAGEATTTAGEATTTAGEATTTAGGATTAPGGEVKPVGLLYDITGRGDKSFNDAAAAGLDKAKAEFGITGNESTPTGDADRADRLNLLVDQGNGLIIGVGFLWTDALAAGAKANADVSFALVDGVASDNNGTPDDTTDDKDLPNVSNLLFAEQEGSFLVGAAAALKSKTGSIGFVGGVEIDLIKKFEAGYIAGAKAVNPDIKIDSKYLTQPPDFTGFNASDKGKEVAKAMYAAGADVVYHAAGGSGLGVFQAAKEAGDPGEVWAIGVDSDQYLTAGPDLQPYILTSMLKRVDVAVYETIKSYVEGSFQAGIRTFDLKADGVNYATSGGFIDDIAPQLEDYKAKIISGEIVVPTTPE
jgi:basic membrane protein A